jgi:hypothetical protein
MSVSGRQVGRQSGLIGGWGDRPSKLPYIGPAISVQVMGSDGGVVSGGAGESVGAQEGGYQEEEVVISDSEIESFILSTEEQKKKYGSCSYIHFFCIAPSVSILVVSVCMVWL